VREVARGRQLTREWCKGNSAQAKQREGDGNGVSERWQQWGMQGDGGGGGRGRGRGTGVRTSVRDHVGMTVRRE